MKLRPLSAFSVVPVSLLRIDISPIALKTWVALARFAGHEGKCWPSTATLAEMLGTNERSVCRGKKELERAGLLGIARRFDDAGRETSSLYTLLYPEDDNFVTLTPGNFATQNSESTSRESDETVRQEGDETVRQEGDETVRRSKPVGSKPVGRDQKSGESAQPVIAHYHDRWKQKYGMTAPLTEGNAGQIARVVKTRGAEATITLLDRFFDGDDKFARETCHSVGAFLACLTRLVAGANGSGPPKRYNNDVWKGRKSGEVRI